MPNDRLIISGTHDGRQIRRKPWTYTIPDNPAKPGDNVFGVYIGFGGVYHWVGITNLVGKIIDKQPYNTITKLNEDWELDL